MSFSIIVTKTFERKSKKLAKKYRTIKEDLNKVFEQLKEEPHSGISLGKNCYKVRMPISDKARGKSGGARIITYVRVVEENIFLLDIYDKADISSISDGELQLLIDLLAD